MGDTLIYILLYYSIYIICWLLQTDVVDSIHKLKQSHKNILTKKIYKPNANNYSSVIIIISPLRVTDDFVVVTTTFAEKKGIKIHWLICHVAGPGFVADAFIPRCGYCLSGCLSSCNDVDTQQDRAKTTKADGGIYNCSRLSSSQMIFF